MRYTAVFSIEMKYYLIMPIVIYFYHIGYKVTSVALCSTLIVGGLVANWFCLVMNDINPGYTNYIDYEFLDLYLLKPWSHIDSYFTGVLLGLFYQEFKIFKFGNNFNVQDHTKIQESSKKQNGFVVRVSNWMINGFGAPGILLGVTLTFIFYFGYSHAWINDIFYQEDEDITRAVTKDFGIGITGQVSKGVTKAIVR